MTPYTTQANPSVFRRDTPTNVHKTWAYLDKYDISNCKGKAYYGMVVATEYIRSLQQCYINCRTGYESGYTYDRWQTKPTPGQENFLYYCKYPYVKPMYENSNTQGMNHTEAWCMPSYCS